MSTVEPDSTRISTILEHITGPSGEMFLDQYARWHHELSRASVREDRELYVRLAALAKEADAIGERELAMSFAELAAIGLGRPTRL